MHLQVSGLLPVIMKSLCGRAGLTDYTSVHKAQRRTGNNTRKLCQTTAVVPKLDESEALVCDVNMREIKTGDVLISRTQETCGNLSATTHTHIHQGEHTHTYLSADIMFFSVCIAE